MEDLTMMAALKRVAIASAAEEAAYAAEEAALVAEQRKADNARQQFLSHCRVATAADYADWLVGYLQSGGEPTHMRSYDFRRRPCWLLDQSPEGQFPELYGAGLLRVIVAAGVRLRVVTGRTGHSSLYFMDGFVVVGDVVPVYPDVLDLITARHGWGPDPAQWNLPEGH